MQSREIPYFPQNKLYVNHFKKGIVHTHAAIILSVVSSTGQNVLVVSQEKTSWGQPLLLWNPSLHRPWSSPPTEGLRGLPPSQASKHFTALCSGHSVCSLKVSGMGSTDGEDISGEQRETTKMWRLPWCCNGADNQGNVLWWCKGQPNVCPPVQCPGKSAWPGNKACFKGSVLPWHSSSKTTSEDLHHQGSCELRAGSTAAAPNAATQFCHSCMDLKASFIFLHLNYE